MITNKDIENWFTYHSPTEDQPAKYRRIRTTAKAFAETILANTPSCADQTVAIRRLRECVMIANAAIACNPEGDANDPITKKPV